MSLDNAIIALQEGEIVLIFDEDDRESETDMVVASQFIKPAHIATMRRSGGGLICTCLTHFMCDFELFLSFGKFLIY